MVLAEAGLIELTLARQRMLETGLLQPNRVNLGDRQDSAEKTRSDHQGSLENSMASGSPDPSDRLQNPFVPRDLLIRASIGSCGNEARRLVAGDNSISLRPCWIAAHAFADG